MTRVLGYVDGLADVWGGVRKCRGFSLTSMQKNWKKMFLNLMGQRHYLTTDQVNKLLQRTSFTKEKKRKKMTYV